MFESLTVVFGVMKDSNLLFHEAMHTVFALPFAAIIWKKSKNIKLVTLVFLVAYLIDLDHLFDYWGYFGLEFDLVKFIKMDYFSGPGKAFIPFHGWEWLIILAYFSFKKGWKSYLTPLSLGVFSHLIWDAISVGSILFYFFSYRALMGFRILI